MRFCSSLHIFQTSFHAALKLFPFVIHTYRATGNPTLSQPPKGIDILG